jgi:predicted amidohydrolase YtcJ
MLYADKTFYNGRIYTMNKPGETVSAIVVRDGKILYAGTDERALAYPSVETEDLGGKVGLPGFNDTHIHTFIDCGSRLNITVDQAKDIAGIIDIMKAHDDGEEGWLFGYGVSMSDLAEGRHPNRYEVDKISTDRPVLLYSHCLHFMMANSKALELAGISKETTPDEESLSYFADGEPDGILREASYTKFMTEPFNVMYADQDYRLNILRQSIGIYAQYGLTTLHCISSLAGAPPMEYFDQYHQLDKEGALPIRVLINSAYLPETLKAPTGFGTDMVKVGAKKIFTDGSLGGRTAAMREPYSDDPNTKGDILYTLEELTALLKEAYDAGIEASAHTIGDASMELLLTAAEAVYPPSDEPDPIERLKEAGLRRLRIIHACMIAPGHVERIKRLPAILDVQPGFLHSDVHIAEGRLGPDRMKYLMAFKTFIDNGILLTGGSDAPVDPPIPLNSIQCAVTRQDLTGFPEGGLTASEAISVYEAVALYTKNAAFCSSEEDVKGTISVGKYADFILLDKDIFTVEPHEISSINVLRTVLGGDTTYRSN